MLIYLVYGYHEENELLGIYTTKELAQRRIDKYIPNESPDYEKGEEYATKYYSIGIEEMEIE